MNDYCLDCARKHLAAARSQLYEFLSGDYNEEFWFAIGDIWLAERHLIIKHPEIANKIRKGRIKLIEEDNYIFDFRSIIQEITEIAIEDQGKVDQ